MLADASNCLQDGVELKLPDPKYVAAYELKPGAFNQAANDPEVSRHMDECLTDWCRQVSMQATCGQAGGQRSKHPPPLQHVC